MAVTWHFQTTSGIACGKKMIGPAKTPDHAEVTCRLCKRSMLYRHTNNKPAPDSGDVL